MTHNHLADLAPRLTELRGLLLHNWDDASLSEAALCERHSITPNQLQAIARLPDFAKDVQILREVRMLRRPHVECSARDAAIATLYQLMRRQPSNATQARESRLAVKQLLTLLDQTPSPKSKHSTTGDRPSVSRTQTSRTTATKPSTQSPAIGSKQQRAASQVGSAAALLQRLGTC